MSALDDLLARSRDPGKLVERHHFTLSREKAIEKQREFALRHQRQYVLEIIQGAIFAGATYLAIDARKNSILIAWVGAPPLEKAHLENLFDYLFADRSDKRIRHMVQLAVGINAILQAEPKSIRLESGDGTRTVRLDMDASGEGDIGISEEPIDGTYLVAEWSSGLLGALFGRWAQTEHIDVSKLIEDRCLYTPVPILLNGEAPFGFRATRNIEIFGARDQEQFDDGNRRGVIALHSSPHAPRGFRMVVGGVWISTLNLQDLSPEPLVGVICDDSLRKTADHSDIVQDARYVQMLHKVQPFANKVLLRADKRYVPPALPAIPKEALADPTDTDGPRIVYEPLPEVLLLLGPRGHTTLDALRRVDGEPLFWCTPEVSKELGEAADPLRFPFRVLRLSEGEANTLGREAKQAQLHRLNSPSDIDFVLRVMERGHEVREVTVPLPEGTLTVRLQVSGRLPAWGNGRAGTPFLVRYNDKTQATGSVEDTHVWTQGLADQPSTYEIGIPIHLPGISLVIETAPGAATMDDEIARRALDAAWQLAAPEDQPAQPELLAALLATQSLPQFSEHPHPSGQTRHPDAMVRLDAALPPSWPVRLRSIPLVDTHLGPLDLDGFLGLLQTGEVAWVRDPEGYARMEPLEKRFGYGHLAPHGVDADPLFAVARIGHRWSWVSDRALFRDGVHFTHLVFVARHKAPRTDDPTWETVEHPFPELVAIRRIDADPIDLDEAWSELYDGLRRTQAENRWEEYAHGTAVERVRGMGRVALMHLANKVEGGLSHPLLLPSDGGARWSIERIRSTAAVRVTAANGVQVSEPHTFALTLAEYQAISPDHAVRLRYDDHPDVWRSLQETSDEGWLLRTEITEARLRGWLGLRLPYDATSGILLRTTGQLIGLPELDERIPCHGLLWPMHGGSRLSTDERQLIQLTGLRMYAQLVDTLKQRLPDEVKRSAQLYAWSFCWRAHQRGRLSGTAMQLARQVEVFGPDGRTWGTLDRWLDTLPARRPPAPADVILPAPPEPTEIIEVAKGPTLSGILDRLNAALPRNIEVQAHVSELGRTAPVEVDPGSSSRSRVVLALNSDHLVVQDGMVDRGPAQELLLLEMARQCSLWGTARGQPISLLRLQQVLLSQRFEDG